jgi:U3 small nucleolar RNA-associated protein 23
MWRLTTVITQCCISELYKTKDQAVIDLAKKCERRRCGHIPDPLSGHDCITACLNVDGENKHRYILATQDDTLRAEMRAIPGVPMMYIRRAVMIMEPPSPASLSRRDTREREKLGGTEKRKRGREDDENEARNKKRKGPKEPNPKSVLKKKKKPIAVEKRTEDKNREDGDGVARDNIIGEVSDLVRRSKSVRRRNKHKKASKGTEDSIPALQDPEGQQPGG